MKYDAQTVLIQLPEGLRPYAFTLVKDIKKRTGANIIISGDSCYGACDLAIKEAEILEADLLIHYGHSKMLPETKIPVIYIEAKAEFDANALVMEALPLLKDWNKVGLASTVQHVHQLNDVVLALEHTGVKATLGSGKGKTPYNGQILGCDYSTAKEIAEEVDGYLFIGGGRFHAIGLAIATGKQVVMANPYTLLASKLDEKEVTRIAMQRMAQITAAREAKRIGVVVSFKPGQFQMFIAKSLRDKLNKICKEAIIICLGDITAISLNNFSEAEAFINTACPRLAIDGLPDLKKPILTVREADFMIGEKKWDEVWGEAYLER